MGTHGSTSVAIMKSQFTDGDWAEVYYAVADKETRIRREGPILQSRAQHRAFVRHLRTIRELLETAFAEAGVSY